MLDKPILTIAIPTYNRHSLLGKTLEQLLPQMTSDCRLLVLDNQSDPPVSQVLGDLLGSFPVGSLEIRSNPENVGGCANVIRCIEEAKTNWVWTLGDDDLVRPDAIDTILRNIRAHPDAKYLNFMLPWLAPRDPMVSMGWEGFVEKMNFKSCGLISLNVYHRPSLSGHFRWAWLYSTSQFPHIAILYGALGKEGQSYFSSDVILDGHATHDGVKQNWPMVLNGIGRANLIDMPMPYETREQLIVKINKSFAMHKNVVMQMVAKALSEGNSRDALYLYDMFCYRNFYFTRDVRMSLKILTYRLLVRFPRFGRWVVGRFSKNRSNWIDLSGRKESYDRI